MNSKILFLILAVCFMGSCKKAKETVDPKAGLVEFDLDGVHQESTSYNAQFSVNDSAQGTENIKSYLLTVSTTAGIFNLAIADRQSSLNEECLALTDYKSVDTCGACNFALSLFLADGEMLSSLVDSTGQFTATGCTGGTKPELSGDFSFKLYEDNNTGQPPIHVITNGKLHKVPFTRM